MRTLDLSITVVPMTVLPVLKLTLARAVDLVTVCTPLELLTLPSPAGATPTNRLHSYVFTVLGDDLRENKLCQHLVSDT